MARQIRVAAAQTGPVLTEDMSKGVEAACELLIQAAGQGADVICFSELFLTPFFPNTLTPDYERFSLTLPSPVTDPLFARARDKHVATIARRRACRGGATGARTSTAGSCGAERR